MSALWVEAGGWLRGPGVPPEPGDRTSSVPCPLNDREDEGGRCNTNTGITSETDFRSNVSSQMHKNAKNKYTKILNM